ncbi:putative membrane protein [Escherichia coli LT-68]|nr:putative membrane protein [Escherichia coli LT-68]
MADAALPSSMYPLSIAAISFVVMSSSGASGSPLLIALILLIEVAH